MKKIVSINGCNFGSTGGIAGEIAKLARSRGMEYYSAYPWAANNRPAEEDDILIGNKWGKACSVMLGRLTGFSGCFSWLATKRFLKTLKRIGPDILHFHNLHDSYINLSMLFAYVKKNKIKVVWTLHDCWAFTAKCPHFTVSGCQRWRGGCHDCPDYRKYPKAYVDQTRRMWKLKKRWFTEVEDMTVVTPSSWLGSLVKESFIGQYPVRVLHNGIDLDVFKPTKGKFRENFGLGGKYIVLGVAMDWCRRKGLDVFIELSKRFSDKFKVVLIGTSDETDKELPDNIISIHRTHNQKELAEIYTAADVFLNPTREEVLGMVNLEALACGTPVITFKTGGSPECIDDSCGTVVECNDIDAMEHEAVRVCETRCFSEAACIARAGLFDGKARFEEYIDLYKCI